MDCKPVALTMYTSITSSVELCTEPVSPCSGSGTRRCYLCKLELPLDRFRNITTSQRRGEKLYTYRGPSSDCRECNREYKRQQRRKKAEREGRRSPDEWNAYVARQQEAKRAEKADRAARWAQKQQAWAAARAARDAMTPAQRAEVKRQAIARQVERERERYNTDPAFQAYRKALKIRRKRAERAAVVVPVNRELVAERDGWKCGICGDAVTRATWSLDHIVPLSKGGAHTYENVVIAHLSCNSSKGNRIVGHQVSAGLPVLVDHRLMGHTKRCSRCGVIGHNKRTCQLFVLGSS